jgi:hypothetical protein
MKVNFKRGAKNFPDFINVDDEKDTKPDHVVDYLKDNLPFKDNSVTEVRAHGFFQTLGEEFEHFVKELYRVCESGCMVDIIVPHHRSDNFYDSFDNKRVITTNNIKELSKKYGDYKVSQGGKSSLAVKLDVDFELVGFNFSISEQYAEAMKDQNNMQQLQELSDRFANVTKEINIQLVVLK